MAKRRLTATERAARRELVARRSISTRLARMVAARVTETERWARAIRRAAGKPVWLAQARARWLTAFDELVKARRLEREVLAIVRETEHQLAAIELTAQTRTLAALARFHASRRPDRLPVARGVDYEQAKYAVAVVVADHRRMTEDITRLEADPDQAREVARLRRALVAQKAHLDLLIDGLRAIREHANPATRQ